MANISPRSMLKFLREDKDETPKVQRFGRPPESELPSLRTITPEREKAAIEPTFPTFAEQGYPKETTGDDMAMWLAEAPLLMAGWGAPAVMMTSATIARKFAPGMTRKLARFLTRPVAFGTMEGGLSAAEEAARTGEPFSLVEAGIRGPGTWTGVEAAVGGTGKVIRAGRKGLKAVGGYVDPTIKKALNATIIPEPLQSAFSGKSVAELFIPIEERATKMFSGMLRKKSRSESLAHTARTEMGPKLQTLDVSEKAFVDKFFASGKIASTERYTNEYLTLPLKSRQKIMDVLRPLDDWLSATTEKNPVREAMRQMEIKEYSSKIFNQLRLSGDLQIGMDTIKGITTQTKGTVKKEKWQKALREVIDSPLATQETKFLAKDYYNLTTNTMETLTRAAQKAEKRILIDKIKSVPGYTSPEAKEGYVLSKHQSFKDMYVTPEVEEAMVGMDKIGEFASTFNRLFLGPWKIGKVILRVPTHFRNMYSNVMLNDWGGLPFYRGDMYWKAAGELRKQGKVAKEFQRLTGQTTTFAGVETAHLPYSLRADTNVLEQMEYMFGKMVRPFAKAYQMEETWAKLAKYMWNMEKGMNKGHAAEDAVKWTFNYGEVTPFVRKLRSTLMPFATWQAKSIPLFFQTAKEHPLRLAKWAMLPGIVTAASLKATGVSDGEWSSIKKMLPQYQREGIHGLLPWRDSEGRLNLMNWAWMMPGFGDMAEMYASDPVSSVAQNPFWTFAGQIAANKKFSGAPIWYEWEPNDVKLYRGLTHAWTSFMPAIIGTDIQQFVKTAKGKEGALTPEMYALSQFGVRATPLDKAKLARQSGFRKKAQIGEWRSRLRKEMEGKSPSQRRKIARKYKEYLQNIQ